MNTDPDPVLLLKQLDRACRIGFLIVTALFTFIALRLSLSIGHFEMIYRDMLSDRPLPILTTLVLSSRMLFLFLSITLPIAAIVVACRVPRADHAIFGISLCSFGLFVISVIMWSGLLKPLIGIVSALTGA
jgi:hypothetical protein